MPMVIMASLMGVRMAVMMAVSGHAILRLLATRTIARPGDARTWMKLAGYRWCEGDLGHRQALMTGQAIE
ncbi:hypothetical protein GCM10009087_03690 [Sphingomonas oligophenolica]